MDDDEYPLTEAEVLDTLQLVVAAEAEHGAKAKCNTAEDAEEEEEAPSSGDAAPQSPQSPMIDGKAKKPSASNQYQNHQKQELEYLKAKVRELESELDRLERENDAKLAQLSDSTWQRMAQQQCVEKQKALSENARLKAMLEGQIKFAKMLERVIRKRPNLSAFGVDSDDTPTGGSRKLRRRMKLLTSASMYDDLSAAAEREFKRTRDVLVASKLMDMQRDHRSIDVKVINADEQDREADGAAAGSNACDMRVDWTIVRRYPFPFQAVARELWKILSYDNVTSHVPDIERNVDRTDDGLFATTTLKVPVGQRQCSLSAAALIRQYIEEDSVTIVWVSDGECETTKAAKDTFKLYEIGWINMQAAPGDPSSCISRTLGYYYPTFSERARGSPSPSSGSGNDAAGSPTEPISIAMDANADMGVLTELLASVYEKSASQIHTLIENSLMAEAVTHKISVGNGVDSHTLAAWRSTCE